MWKADLKGAVYREDGEEACSFDQVKATKQPCTSQTRCSQAGCYHVFFPVFYCAEEKICRKDGKCPDQIPDPYIRNGVYTDDIALRHNSAFKYRLHHYGINNLADPRHQKQWRNKMADCRPHCLSWPDGSEYWNCVHKCDTGGRTFIFQEKKTFKNYTFHDCKLHCTGKLDVGSFGSCN